MIQNMRLFSGGALFTVCIFELKTGIIQFSRNEIRVLSFTMTTTQLNPLNLLSSQPYAEHKSRSNTGRLKGGSVRFERWDMREVYLIIS